MGRERLARLRRALGCSIVTARFVWGRCRRVARQRAEGKSGSRHQLPGLEVNERTEPRARSHRTVVLAAQRERHAPATGRCHPRRNVHAIRVGEGDKLGRATRGQRVRRHRLGDAHTDGHQLHKRQVCALRRERRPVHSQRVCRQRPTHPRRLSALRRLTAPAVLRCPIFGTARPFFAPRIFLGKLSAREAL